MKWVLTAIVALLSACTGNEYRYELTYVDSLAERDADKAKLVLDSIGKQMPDVPQRERMYYDLLRIKVDNCLYKANTEDSVARMLVAFYEGEGDKRLLSQAYYYAGKVYKALNDTPRAMDFFFKTLSLVEGTNTKLEGQVYSQLGYIYSKQWLDDDALRMFEKAHRCYEHLRDTTGIIFALGDLSLVYRNMEQTDTALKYTLKAMEYAKLQGNQEIWKITEPKETDSSSNSSLQGQNFGTSLTSLKETAQVYGSAGRLHNDIVYCVVSQHPNLFNEDASTILARVLDETTKQTGKVYSADDRKDINELLINMMDCFDADKQVNELIEEYTSLTPNQTIKDALGACGIVLEGLQYVEDNDSTYIEKAIDLVEASTIRPELKTAILNGISVADGSVKLWDTDKIEVKQ